MSVIPIRIITWKDIFEFIFAFAIGIAGLILNLIFSNAVIVAIGTILITGPIIPLVFSLLGILIGYKRY